MILALRKFWIFLRVCSQTLYSATLIYFISFLSSSSKRGTIVGKIANNWGLGLMKILDVEYITQGQPISNAPVLFVGNHMSYIDIPLFYAVRDPGTGAAFVAKKEVSKWPIFGYAAASAGTVFVDRSSPDSRKKTTIAMREAILEKKKSVIVFPEGTSSLSGKDWKPGALKMAKDANIEVQPFVIFYTPPRAAAFIDDDNFAPHLWSWIGKTKIVATIHFLPLMQVKDHLADTKTLQDKVQEIWGELDSQDKIEKANKATPFK